MGVQSRLTPRDQLSAQRWNPLDHIERHWDKTSEETARGAFTLPGEGIGGSLVSGSSSKLKISYAELVSKASETPFPTHLMKQRGLNEERPHQLSHYRRTIPADLPRTCNRRFCTEPSGMQRRDSPSPPMVSPRVMALPVQSQISYEHSGLSTAPPLFCAKLVQLTPDRNLQAQHSPGYLKIIMSQLLDGHKFGLSIVEGGTEPVLMVEAIPDPRAFRFGWAVGDRVLRVNGIPVYRVPEFVREVSKAVAMYQTFACPVVFDIWRHSSLRPAELGFHRAATNALLHLSGSQRLSVMPAAQEVASSALLVHGSHDSTKKTKVQEAQNISSQAHTSQLSSSLQNDARTSGTDRMLWMSQSGIGKYGPDGMLLEERKELLPDDEELPSMVSL